MGALTRWVTRRLAAVIEPSGPTPVAPELERSRTFLEKVARWREIFALEKALRPSRAALEQAEEAARARRQEQTEDMIAMHVAHHGYWWPNEPLEGPGASGGLGGVIDLFASDPRQAQYDWRAEVDERQRQEIGNGGRG